MIIASNLLGEHTGAGIVRLEPTNNDPKLPGLHGEWDMLGVAWTLAISASLSWLLSWIATRPHILKFAALSLVVAVLLLILDASRGRQQLQALRQEAIQSAKAVVSNFRALDSSSSAAIVMIQEVEAISRGYHLYVHHRIKPPSHSTRNGGVPPVTIIDGQSATVQSRRCSRLRRLLVQLYAANIPLIIDACRQLEPLTATDDVERYLEIYEVAEADVHEALSGAVVAELDDQESLRALRAVHLRFAILRRVFLCHLLSLGADGTAADAGPWRDAVRAADRLAAACGQWAERVNAMVGEDERPQQAVPSTPTHGAGQRTSPARERYRQQLRRANEIAAELRAMQAKLFVLRDDAGRLLEPGAGATGNLTALPALFAAQAESLGQDLRQLNRSFDGWRAAVAGEAQQRQRSSMGSSGGLRSPLSAVGENAPFGGTPAEALRALTGTDSGPSSGGGSPHASSTTDEEVFEAVAAPRLPLRRSFTREEKMARMQEDETRRAIAREKRLTSSNLMRELESVIGARAGSKRMSTGRIPQSSRVSSL
jgi:hypothetical protein